MTLALFDDAPEPAPKKKQGKPSLGVMPAPASEQVQALAQSLPEQLRLGTSSWTFVSKQFCCQQFQGFQLFIGDVDLLVFGKTIHKEGFVVQLKRQQCSHPATFASAWAGEGGSCASCSANKALYSSS
jgi:hypothetical protein